MRRLFNSLPFLLLITAATVFTSCSKDGAAGPAGEQGAKGDKGDKGDPGAAGPKGDAGSANVIYSDWLDVAYKPDTIHLAGGGIDTIGYYATINAPKLTKALLSTAEVKVYINVNNAADPGITPLPYTGSNGLYISLFAYETSLELYSNADVSTFTNAGAKYQQYRYMIIPGGTTARTSTAVDWNNYASVKAYLGLKD